MYLVRTLKIQLKENIPCRACSLFLLRYYINAYIIPIIVLTIFIIFERNLISVYINNA